MGGEPPAQRAGRLLCGVHRVFCNVVVVVVAAGAQCGRRGPIGRGSARVASGSQRRTSKVALFELESVRNEERLRATAALLGPLGNRLVMVVVDCRAQAPTWTAGRSLELKGRWRGQKLELSRYLTAKFMMRGTLPASTVAVVTALVLSGSRLHRSIKVVCGETAQRRHLRMASSYQLRQSASLQWY